LRAAVASSSKALEGEKERSTKRQKKASKVLIDSEDEEEAAPAPTAGPSTAVEEEEEDNDAELSEGSEIDTDEELVHETTDTTSKRKRKLATKLPKYTPADETSQDRDRRSIFVGNLPIEVTKSKVSHHPYSRYQD
jgi:nucleolar protein 12